MVTYRSPLTLKFLARTLAFIRKPRWLLRTRWPGEAPLITGHVIIFGQQTSRIDKLGIRLGEAQPNFNCPGITKHPAAKIPPQALRKASKLFAQKNYQVYCSENLVIIVPNRR